jgi:hypothetical protein
LMINIHSVFFPVYHDVINSFVSILTSHLPPDSYRQIRSRRQRSLCEGAKRDRETIHRKISMPHPSKTHSKLFHRLFYLDCRLEHLSRPPCFALLVKCEAERHIVKKKESKGKRAGAFQCLSATKKASSRVKAQSVENEDFFFAFCFSLSFLERNQFRSVFFLLPVSLARP